MQLISPHPDVRIALPQHYEAKPVLTASEASFYQLLLKHTIPGRVQILIKPRLADFLDHQKDLVAFNKISQKHVDFLVCRPEDWMPMLGIELDDDSHSRSEVKKRDMFVNAVFGQAGIPLLRIHVCELENIACLVQKLSQAWSQRRQRLEC